MQTSAIERRNRWARPFLSFLVASAVAFAVYYIGFECLLVNWQGDQAWLLYAAKLTLSGVPLDGSQLIETNPPLIVWFSMLPVLMARVFHISSLLALKLVMLTILGASSAWSARLLRMAEPQMRRGKLLLIVLTILLVELTMQPAEFAQREQIVFALLLPYVLAVTTSALQRLSLFESCALGLAAGVSVCVKPQQLVTLLSLEIFLAIIRRSLRRIWRPELLAAVSVGLVYVLLVYTLTPYIQQIVPLLNDTYWALGEYTFSAMVLKQGIWWLLGILVTALVWWFSRARLSMPWLVAGFLVSSLGASLAWDLQHTGWSYQMFPERAFLFLAVFVMAIDLWTTRDPELFSELRVPPLLWLCVGMIAVGSLVGTARYRARHVARQSSGTMVAELRSYPPHTRISIYSLAMPYFSIIVDRDLVWSSRFAHLWMLPAIVENQYGRIDVSRRFKALPPNRLAALTDLQRNDSTEDLELWKPQIVFVERCPAPHSCSALDRSFDTLAWFQQSPAFAREWAHYKKSRTIEAYDVYTRID